MDLSLHRVDLRHGEAIAQGTLVVLPVGKKKQQKIAVGDDSGMLEVFFMKKGEVSTEWKSPALGREITSVVMQMGKDRLFVGCGQSIHGFTRKGKEFVKVKTNLNETIAQLFVHENMIWTGSEYIMNIYDQCKDFGFVVVKDRINDLVCAPVLPDEILVSILACQDKHLRAYVGERQVHEFAVEGAGTALGFYHGQPEELANQPILMMYGTEQGTSGFCTIDQNAMRRTGTISDRQQRPGTSGPAAATRRARVSAIRSADVMKSGGKEVIIGRDDGNLEVWAVGSGMASEGGGDSDIGPSLLFETCLQESIQALDSGNITGGDDNELVLTTYGGKVLAFSPSIAARDPTGTEIAQVEEAAPQTMLQQVQAAVHVKRKKHDKSHEEDAAVKQEKERRHKALESEVERLRQALEKEKASYQRLSGEQIAMQTTTKVSHRFNLNSEEAYYVLTIESQAALELVALRSDVEVDLLDHDGTSAILSRSKGDPDSPLLATYRMQEPGMRFQIRLRTVEGLQGNISCFVVPQTSPKTAHLVSLAVRPLSLHEKVTDPLPDIPMNQLRLQGNFSTRDMHAWLSLCVNELPARATEEEMTISYKSTFVGTLLHGTYTRNSAVFRSDSITTISALKDLITREAASRRIMLNMTVDVKDETFPRFLELIHPKLSFQHSLTQQVRMVEPLKEVQLQEGETQFLSQELQLVLNHAADIQQQFELQPQRLAFLHNIVIAAYQHKWRLKGHQSVEHRIKPLQKLLENYNLETLTAFFDEPID